MEQLSRLEAEGRELPRGLSCRRGRDLAGAGRAVCKGAGQRAVMEGAVSNSVRPERRRGGRWTECRLARGDRTHYSTQVMGTKRIRAQIVGPVPQTAGRRGKL